MARAQHQKLARESTAAYAASQALFDALRNGTSKIGEQKFHLTQARDLVQNVHVKLVNANGKNDSEKHQRYIECVVRAWKSATEVYSAIFEELASVTAADANEGREMAKGHAEFQAMAETAAAARKVAGSYALSANTPQPTPKPAKRVRVEDGDDDDESENEGASASQPRQPKADSSPTNPHLLALLGKRSLPADETNNEPPQKVQKLSDNIRQDAQGHKVFWERGAEKPNVPYATLGASEKKAWKAEKSRQKREKNSAKRAKDRVQETGPTPAGPDGRPLGPDRRAKGIELGGDTLATGPDFIPLDAEFAPAAAGEENKVPGVEYEDVSAEVAARLKAKEDRKKAKKAEKKRKRESGDSVLEPGLTEGAMEKPEKKKVKAKQDASGLANGVGLDGVAKRKQEVGAVTEDAGEGRKKRKKSKE